MSNPKIDHHRRKVRRWCFQAAEERSPRLENGVAKVPILFDDCAMFRYGVPFETWRRKALELIDTHTFVVFSLHDCYADLWLPHYTDSPRAIGDKGRFCTLDEIAADVALAHARWP